MFRRSRLVSKGIQSVASQVTARASRMTPLASRPSLAFVAAATAGPFSSPALPARGAASLARPQAVQAAHARTQMPQRSRASATSLLTPTQVTSYVCRVSALSSVYIFL